MLPNAVGTIESRSRARAALASSLLASPGRATVVRCTVPSALGPSVVLGLSTMPRAPNSAASAATSSSRRATAAVIADELTLSATTTISVGIASPAVNSSSRIANARAAFVPSGSDEAPAKPSSMRK